MKGNERERTVYERRGKERNAMTRTGTERQVRNGKATQWKDNGKERKGKGNESNGKH